MDFLFEKFWGIYLWFLAILAMVAISIFLATHINNTYAQNLGNLGQFVSGFAILIAILDYSNQNRRRRDDKTVEILEKQLELKKEFLQWKNTFTHNGLTDEKTMALIEIFIAMETLSIRLRGPHSLSQYYKNQLVDSFSGIHSDAMVIANHYKSGLSIKAEHFPNLFKLITV